MKFKGQLVKLGCCSGESLTCGKVFGEKLFFFCVGKSGLASPQTIILLRCEKVRPVGNTVYDTIHEVSSSRIAKD